jgi:uncharacterized membrane protein
MTVTKEKVLIGLGVWLFVLPFTGFPASWKTWLIAITGLVVIYLGALLLKASRERERAMTIETKTGTFTETIEHSL